MGLDNTKPAGVRVVEVPFDEFGNVSLHPLLKNIWKPMVDKSAYDAALKRIAELEAANAVLNHDWKASERHLEMRQEQLATVVRERDEQLVRIADKAIECAKLIVERDQLQAKLAKAIETLERYADRTLCDYPEDAQETLKELGE